LHFLRAHLHIVVGLEAFQRSAIVQSYQVKFKEDSSNGHPMIRRDAEIAAEIQGDLK